MSNTRKARPVGKPTGPLDLDVLQREADEDGTYAPFPFVLDGQDHELVNVQMLTTEQALAIEMGEARDVIREIAGAEMADRLLKLPTHAMNALMEGWLAHAGVQPGESAASSSS
jgi:hypothetical protein